MEIHNVKGGTQSWAKAIYQLTVTRVNYAFLFYKNSYVADFLPSNDYMQCFGIGNSKPRETISKGSNTDTEMQKEITEAEFRVEYRSQSQKNTIRHMHLEQFQNSSQK